MERETQKSDKQQIIDRIIGSPIFASWVEGGITDRRESNLWAIELHNITIPESTSAQARLILAKGIPHFENLVPGATSELIIQALETWLQEHFLKQPKERKNVTSNGYLEWQKLTFPLREDGSRALIPEYPATFNEDAFTPAHQHRQDLIDSLRI